MEVQPNSSILLKCIPGTQSVRRVASQDRFKTAECPPQLTSLSYVHYKRGSEYGQKQNMN